MNISASLLILTLVAPPRGAAQADCPNHSLAGCTPALVAMVNRASATLDSLARLPTPSNASAADRPIAVRFGAWLRQAAARLARLGALARKQKAAPLPGSGKALTPFGQQTLALQARLLTEGQQYAMATAQLKVRHDAAMASIRNIR
jgi:hypothetical protein